MKKHLRIPFFHHVKIIMVFSLLLIGLLLAQDNKPLYSEVKIFIKDRTDIVYLQSLGMGLDHLKVGDDYVQAVLDERQLNLLRESGYPYEILIPDLIAEVQSRNLSPSEMKALEKKMKKKYNISGFEFGSLNGYYNFNEVVQELDSMRILYPDLVSARQSIGQSIEGRDIWMVKISDNPDIDEGEPEILYTALHHAREPQSMATIMYFMYYVLEAYNDPGHPDHDWVVFLLENRELYFIPVVNPDGYVYVEQQDLYWRKNRRNNGDGSFGVDLNRNYGYQWGYDNVGSSPDPYSSTYRGTGPFSEPETQAIRDFCNAHEFQLALNYHSYSNLLIYPWGYINQLTPDANLFIDLAVDMTQYNGYTHGNAPSLLYPVNGEANDWMYGEQSTKEKIFGMTPEVGSAFDGFWPPIDRIFPLAQENVYPNLVLAQGDGVIIQPNPPQNVTAYSDYTTPTSILLNWVDPHHYASGDTLLPSDIVIEIKRDGSLIGSVPGGTQQFVDSGLQDGQLYTYELYARVITSQVTSGTANVSWYAGGSPIPAPVTSFSVGGNSNEVTIYWTAPTQNEDGTPMDDYAGIRLYMDGTPVTTFTGTPSDTGGSFTAAYTPADPGYYQWYVTVIDNESPVHESQPSEILGTPLSVPFADHFSAMGTPNPALWTSSTVQINNRSSNPPSEPYALNLNGHPNGEDIIELNPIDISGLENSSLVLRYYYQPQGNGNAPEPEDSLRLYFKNDLGEWIRVKAYPGTTLTPFQEEVILLDTVSAGSGTFFFSQFQLKFRSTGGAGNFPNDDWFIDDVYLGPLVAIPGTPEQMLPRSFVLEQNYPNPFNPATTIRYQLPERSDVRLEIYDVLGQKIRTLVAHQQEAGSYSVKWDGRSETGASVTSGVYFYRLFARSATLPEKEFEHIRKMILLR
ncbi:MAG: T9SS C-terminal target domain-containing protein [Calditrichaeota bacterium]|nr:MAG: T9SS C-terminal target domain-containing protein [Calditrichota bacterium]